MKWIDITDLLNHEAFVEGSSVAQDSRATRLGELICTCIVAMTASSETVELIRARLH